MTLSAKRKYAREYMRTYYDAAPGRRERYRQRKREYLRRHRAAITLKNRTEHPEWKRAWNAVYRAVRNGKLTRPYQCSSCGVVCKPHAHHPDYSKLLEVIWLCMDCHIAESHRRERMAA